MNRIETHAEYSKMRKDVCSAVTELYGDFKRDYILAKNVTEKEVHDTISQKLPSLSDYNDVERYIFISGMNGNTIIKR